MSLLIKELSKSFDQKQIFENFSYEFSEYGIYAIVGNSGVGKTTLLRMIAGLDSRYTGEIIGGGLKNTAYAFQEHRLFPNLTALENAVIPNGDTDNTLLVDKAKKLFSVLGFSDPELQLYPDELSGGMRQRVSIIRALLKDAPILLLDEPTKELDSDIREELYGIIIDEAKKRLVIMVSHNTLDFERINAKRIYI